MAFDLTPKAIIGLVIGVIITISVLAFGIAILGILTPAVDEATQNNFNVLTAKLESLMESEDAFYCNILEDSAHSFYILDGIILVGYNYDENKQESYCTKEYATKPVFLKGKAGLCLHTDGIEKDFDGGPSVPIQCYVFDKNVTFFAYDDRSIYGGFGGAISNKEHPLTSNKYEDLFIYGSECDIGEPDFGATKLYLEVYKKDGEVYVYIDEHKSESQIKRNTERCELLYERTKPTESVPEMELLFRGIRSPLNDAYIDLGNENYGQLMVAVGKILEKSKVTFEVDIRKEKVPDVDLTEVVTLEAYMVALLKPLEPAYGPLTYSVEEEALVIKRKELEA